MAISTFKKLDAKQSLHRGTSDLAAMPESRLAERVFGADGPGRSKGLSSGLSIGQLLGGEYDPRADSCLEAFARLL